MKILGVLRRIWVKWIAKVCKSFTMASDKYFEMTEDSASIIDGTWKPPAVTLVK